MTLVYLAIAWLVGIALAKTISLPWQVLPVKSKPHTTITASQATQTALTDNG